MAYDTKIKLEEILSQLEYTNCLSLTENGLLYYSPWELAEEVEWGDWQKNLKILAYYNQDKKCPCGKSVSTAELHHALITKSDVQGIKDSFAKGKILHHSFNVILICKAHHEKQQRDESFEYLCKIYGEREVKKWYNSLPLKALRKIE
jgi:hypothetical protein